MNAILRCSISATLLVFTLPETYASDWITASQTHVIQVSTPLAILTILLILALLIYALYRLRRLEAGYTTSEELLAQAERHVGEISKQNQRLQKDINTDGLTKIGNRAHFDVSYRLEWDRALRNHEAIALLMIDIDFFKRVNDAYGHVVGDECLIAVALAIRGCLLRASDRVMRYGGEEFAVLLGSTDLPGVKCIAERIIDAVRSLQFNEGFQLTVSIGGASIIPLKEQNYHCFVELVDVALYSAKERGRDRVVLVETSDLLNQELSQPHLKISRL